MLQHVTLRTTPLRGGTRGNMCIDIDGVKYYSTAEVLEATGVSRQTLWRWRQEGRVPFGHHFRDGQVLFAESEYNDILAHSKRVEPARPAVAPGQLGLRFPGHS